MNLHIGVDNKFIERVYDTIAEAGLLSKNKFLIRSSRKPEYIRHDVPYAAVYTSKFNAIVGDTLQYDRVIIHQFSPLLFRWVAKNNFKSLAWAIWGSDLYDLPFIKFPLYEKETADGFSVRRKNLNNFLYLLKYFTGNAIYKDRAYRKVTEVLTWMKSEFEFAKANIPSLNASHEFFFYENQVPYNDLGSLVTTIKADNPNARLPRLIIGNSATPTNNHLDAVRFLEDNSIHADLVVPLSYGDPAYVKFLKQKLNFYTGGKVEYVDQRMDFKSYLNFLNSADGLVMNNIRPQGYGNILMMVYLQKTIYLNKKNISTEDLSRIGIPWTPMNDIKQVLNFPSSKLEAGRATLLDYLSHDRSLAIFKKMFS